MSEADASGRSITELRQMDRETARNTLPVAEFERWEKLTELHDRADETRQQWEDDADTVADIAVNADMSDLATPVELYGNDLLVHIESDNSAVEAHIDAVDGVLGDRDPAEAGTLDRDEKETVIGHMLDLFGEICVEWNGHAWADLPEDTRADVLADIGRKWGVDGLLNAWFDVVEAIAADREEKVSTVESFRNPERRGRR